MPLQATSGAASYDAFGGGALAVAPQAEAIDFDGTNDYLSRASDLTGNADGRTFTFSCWVWMGDAAPPNATQYLYSQENTGFTTTGRFEIYLSFSSGFATLNVSGLIPGSQSSSAIIVRSSLGRVNGNTWIHILTSVDTNATDSTFRVFLNDVSQSLSYTVFGVSDVDFAGGQPRVGYGTVANPGVFKGRLSNVFLDYTYRDLSVEANRRLFITADLKPAAGQAALSPIMYLPMSDPTQPGLNQGTGGNFTLTGVVARSGRGPNQYNAPYSTFDGASDFMSRGPLSGIYNTSFFLLAFNFRLTSNPGARFIFRIQNQSGLSRFTVSTTTAGIVVSGFDATNNLTFSATSGSAPVVGRNYNVVVSQGSVNAMYVNGVEIVGAITVNSGTTVFAPTAPGTNTFIAAQFANNVLFPGTIGPLWFDIGTSLQSAADLLKFVTGTGINAAPVDLGSTGQLPKGTSPLVYLPMYGNNAGKNYGTGGDFTVNSGPYTGARGPNEFWGNWCGEENGDVGYLSRTGVSGINTGKTFSLRTRMQTRVGVSGLRCILSQQSPNFLIEVNSSDALVLTARNSAGTEILSATSANSAITPGTLYDLAINIDLSNTSNRRVSLNGGQSALSMTWTTYINDTLGLNTSTLTRVFCRATDTTSLFYGKLGEFYFTTDYIDFSQEVNRLKFRDAFGNPVDLTQQIQAGAIPNPAIYMRFPPGSFGTNSGTGGAFTQTGNMFDGGQF